VVATASRPETEAWAKELGAHHVIDHRRPLGEALRAAGLEQADYIAGLTASDQHHAALAEVVAPQGHIVLIDDPKTFDIVPFKRKSVTISWELMFTRSIFDTNDMFEQRRLLTEVSSLVDAGVLRSTMREHLGAINAATLKEAHAKLESGRTIGKVVLEGFR